MPAAGNASATQPRSPASQPEAVVFDIGRVLVQWSIRALYEKLIADPVQLDWFLTHVISEKWHFQHDTGVPLAAMIAARGDEFPDHRQLIEAYGPRWLETVPGPVPGTRTLVEQLAARGLPLYAITNFGADSWAMFRPTFPILDHFSDIVVSAHERLTKPDPAIYALAARRFGHAPRDMLFIDDSTANIAAAAELGWQTHHFGDAAGLAADLRTRGLID